jgi:outer membrane lipopolysaccharide assembly protein LptE/RlpB
MRNDAVQQILNRLAAARLQPAEALDPLQAEPSLFE